MSVTRRDPHPARAVMAARGVTNRQAAIAIGCTAAWVGRMLNGYVPVSPELDVYLTDALGLPTDVLFHRDQPDADVVRIVDPADLVAFVEASRLSQGLPPRVTDPATLSKIAIILAGAGRQLAEAAG